MSAKSSPKVQESNPQAEQNPSENYVYMRANHVLGTQFESDDDMFKIHFKFSDDKVISSDVHALYREAKLLKYIPYDDFMETNQIELIEALKEEGILIAVKNHVIKPEQDFKEQMKLHCSHIQILTLTEINGKLGAMTINNPQAYQNGLFGEPDYPMTFIRLKFPGGLKEEDRKGFIKNIKTWLLILNTFTVFPEDYNGGDPLSALTHDEILEYGDHLLRGLCGYLDSINWLKKAENHLYCAELAYMALNLGLKYPLNSKYIPENLIEKICEEIQTKKFLDQNENSYIKGVSIELSSESLEPIGEDINAIEPFYMSDMIESFIKHTVPRFKNGEDCKKYQAILYEQSIGALKSMAPDVFNSKMSHKIDNILAEITELLLAEYPSYESFRMALDKKLLTLNTTVREISGKDKIYIPPHAFLIRMLENELENKIKGVLGFEYFAHGMHKSILVQE